MAAIREWLDGVHDDLPATMGRGYVQGLLQQLDSLVEDTP